MAMNLVILGLLMEGDKHPYEMQQVMQERHMEHYIKLAKGSLYYAVEKLLKQEQIAVREVVKDQSRPDKTIYYITEKGKGTFQELLKKQFKAETNYYHPMYTALAFIHLGDSEMISRILKDRIEHTKFQLEMLERVYQFYGDGAPHGSVSIMKNAHELCKVELAWLEKLHSDALDGLFENNRKIKNEQRP
ncbi:PadR family transcriptional regulator [Bacillus tianshenii]|uniref:PadR family transcriptional regulator n=1 Tax=Sutcliffiella tianshenii TaxID=1463404 RepID=UPI00384F516B